MLLSFTKLQNPTFPQNKRAHSVLYGNMEAPGEPILTICQYLLQFMIIGSISQPIYDPWVPLGGRMLLILMKK